MTSGAYLAILGVVVLERGVELVLSKRNAAWARGRGGLEAGRSHYGVMVVMHALFLVSCALEPLVLGRTFPGAVGWVCLGVALAAQVLRWWAIATLGRRWNTRVIVLPGAEPVTGGPYRWFPHPNYVAVVMELVALPMIFGAWLTALTFTVLNAALLVVRIRVEERALGPRWRAVFRGEPDGLERRA